MKLSHWFAVMGGMHIQVVPIAVSKDEYLAAVLSAVAAVALLLYTHWRSKHLND